MTEPRTPFVHGLIVLASAAACGGWEVGQEQGPAREGGAASSDCPKVFDPDLAEEKEPHRGFHVVENRIQNSEGRAVMLRGVNRSGGEYQCTKGTGFFDGAANEEAVRAMARWKINAVRVPLNETCWLAGGGLSQGVSGENYKQAIMTYVAFLKRYGLTPILDLHWAAPGHEVAVDLWPMPNADHTVDFWTDVALTFLEDDAVIFEPYNEPYPDRNSRSEAAWACWRDGCTECSKWECTETSGGRCSNWECSQTYEAVGMQALVDAIRSTGSEHLILLGGVEYSNDLSGWLDHRPEDPIENLAAAWHVYEFNFCSHAACWNDVPLQLSEQVPIVVTELGQSDCQGDFVAELIEWLEQRSLGYLAWSWNAFGSCVPSTRANPGNAYSLITSYTCPRPNGGFADTFYQALEDHAP